jgi:hypothetical protein
MRGVDEGDNNMYCHNENAPVVNPLVRFATSLALALLLGAPAFAVDSGDIVVSAVKGDVRVSMNGAARDVRAGSVLELPASVRTGSDGAIELKQGATSVSVGPDTELEFPALEKRGAPVDRIVQPRGNAFYDIGKREGRKLRVETPYLVGVIKGTQFNVAAQDGATTISLFEGRLEVRAADDSDVVDLRAGEIASRRRGDKSISVVKMDEKAPATAPRSQNQSDGNDNGGGEKPVTLLHGDTRDVGLGATVSPVSAGVDVSAEAGNGVRVDATTNPSIDVGPIDVVTDVRASIDVGGGAAAVDVSVTAGVDVGPAISVDTGANVSLDVGGNGVSVDVGASTDLAAGPLTTALDAGAAVDLGPAGVGVDVGAGLAAGVGDVAAVDTGIDLAANLGAGAVDVATAVDVGANVAGIDAGVSAGVDVGAGAIDVGLNLGGIDIDLGVDLGLDDGNNGNGNDAGGTDSSNPGNSAPATPPGNIIDDVGGLLDGLLRRPGRR